MGLGAVHHGMGSMSGIGAPAPQTGTKQLPKRPRRGSIARPCPQAHLAFLGRSHQGSQGPGAVCTWALQRGERGEF